MLTFRLGAEVFGVDILRVKEIRGWSPVTRIPQTEACMLGVLNLRGAVVPVIDMRLRFELANAEYNALTVIIVLSVGAPENPREVGLVVDAVSEVVDVSEDAVHQAPEIGDRVTEHISGLLTIGQDMVILLDVDRLIGPSSNQIQDLAA
jgi:purine-binding chemotaxis protein CheW